MPALIDPQLSIQIDRVAQTASVAVTCGLEFTDSEVREMNLFARTYMLECHLLDEDPLRSPGDLAIAFDSQQFPRLRDEAEQYAEATFKSVAATSTLARGAYGKDSTLLAELALSNEDLGIVAVKRSPAVAVDLTQ